MSDAWLWLGQPWLNLRFYLALCVCELGAPFFVSSFYINLILLLVSLPHDAVGLYVVCDLGITWP